MQKTRSIAAIDLLRGAVCLALCGLALCPAALTESPEYMHGIARSAWDQIAAIQREKATWTPAQRKISFKLLLASKSVMKQRVESDMPRLRDSIETDAKGLTRVDIRGTVTSALLGRIAALGGVVVNSHPNYHAVRAMVPLTALQELANEAAVTSIRQGRDPMTQKVDTSEGDVAHRAVEARAAFGVDGSGVKIGVLSDNVSSFALASLQSSGDLPKKVTILPGQQGSGNSEGTAMLEIIHDLAPGAALYFATALGSEAQFAANIVALKDAGCQVIVDDIFYFDEPVFQDGIVARAVEEVAAAGVSYFATAGNAGSLNKGTAGVYEGDFSGTTAPTPVNGTVHDFGSGQNYDEIIADSPNGYGLQWSDEANSSFNDYDLYLLDSTRSIVWDSSADAQNGFQQPYEFISSFNVDDTGKTLVVVRFSGANRYIHLNSIRGSLSIATPGQTNGHACTENSFGIGAVDVGTVGGQDGTFDGSEVVEQTSSDGPRRVFYDADGIPYTPGDLSSSGGVIRNKPDLVAADGVGTATPGFETFFGTSAAAPHAAAIAALLIDQGHATTPAQVREALVSTAIDIEAPGFDRDSGYGIIDALGALMAPYGANNLALLSPTGGEKWRAGTHKRIKWISIGSPGDKVRIEILRHGSVVKTIASATKNDGLFRWPVPADVLPGNQYRVRITSVSNATATDTSPRGFRIKAAKELPNAGRNIAGEDQ